MLQSTANLAGTEMMQVEFPTFIISESHEIKEQSFDQLQREIRCALFKLTKRRHFNYHLYHSEIVYLSIVDGEFDKDRSGTVVDPTLLLQLTESCPHVGGSSI